jgi:hypothetical protein
MGHDIFLLSIHTMYELFVADVFFPFFNSQDVWT